MTMASVDTKDLDNKKSNTTSSTKTKEDNGTEKSGKRELDEDDKIASTSDVKQPQAKKIKRKHTDPAILQLRRTLQECCATNDLSRAIEAYDQAIKDGTTVEAQSFYNLLNLCDGLGDRGLHVGTPKPDSEAETKKEPRPQITPNDQKTVNIDIVTRQFYAERIKDHMDRLNLPLIETAYSALIKIYSKSRNLTKAERLLQEAETVNQCKPRLRLYSPLLLAYCGEGDMVGALKVWQRLSNNDTNSQPLMLSEREYIALIRCASRVGDAHVMERLLTDLSEDVPVPSKEACRAILLWFKSSSACCKPQRLSSETANVLKHIKVPYSDHVASTMGPVSLERGFWEIDELCEIDSKTGALESGRLKGAVLQPVGLSDQAWKDMLQMNENIVVSGKLEEDKSIFLGGKKGRKRTLDEKALVERQLHWKSFQTYLSKRFQERKIDVVIDGANVGYFEQNFAGAPRHVDYYQIDWVVRHFRELGKSVLLVMHQRHFTAKMMPTRMEYLMNNWLNDDILYRTPPGMNDDWFWLHAALSSGPGTLVLSNDEMRDHHFQMLAPRAFLRWKDRHLVHFSFGNWETDSNGKKTGRTVLLRYPEIYSRRIQRVKEGLVIPLPKRGDENRFLDGVFVASEQEPEEETYVCLCPTIDS